MIIAVIVGLAAIAWVVVVALPIAIVVCGWGERTR